jgi:ribosome maturation factor RimP
MQRHHLADIIEPVVEALGFETVRILTIGDSNPTLQIMVDYPDGSKEITVDDCAAVSRALSKELDEKDPIDNRYTLEVSSPGLDRPLTKLAHFARYVNYTVKLETLEPIEKRKRFKGIIKNVSSAGLIDLEMDGTVYQLPFDNITKAKIVITDELWEEYLKNHKSSEA